VVTKLSTLPLAGIAPSGASLLKQVIDKHDPMSNETVVAHRYALANETMRLDTRAMTNHHAALHFHKRPHKTMVTKLTTIEVARFYYGKIHSVLDINNSGS
jgi:hypothetical protein